MFEELESRQFLSTVPIVISRPDMLVKVNRVSAKVDALKAERPSLPVLASVWLMRKSGAVVQVKDPTAKTLMAELNAAIAVNDPIINLSIQGHGGDDNGTMYVGEKDFIQMEKDSKGNQKIILYESDGTRTDIMDTMNKALNPNATVQLKGCNTGKDSGSIAEKMSTALPGHMVVGGNGKLTQLWRNTVIPWGGWKYFRDGKQI